MVKYGYPRRYIKEDLDDKDTFRNSCNYYNCDNRPDSEQFHQAHTAGFDNALKSSARVGVKFADVLRQEMAKFGYSLVDTGKMLDYGGPWNTNDWVLKENVETVPVMHIHDLALKVGDWVELGPPASPAKVQTGEGLDDQDEFIRSDVDMPPTPVQVVGIRALERGSRFHIRLNNFNLLNQPDTSGVTWHNRPKHFQPSWYESWYNGYYDDVLYELYEKGQLRKIDNIEQWFQAQPEK